MCNRVIVMEFQFSFPVLILKDILNYQGAQTWLRYRASISHGITKNLKTGSARARVVCKEAGGEIVDFVLTFPRAAVAVPKRGRCVFSIEDQQEASGCEEVDSEHAVGSVPQADAKADDAKGHPSHASAQTNVVNKSARGRRRKPAHTVGHSPSRAGDSEQCVRPARRRERPVRFRDFDVEVDDGKTGSMVGREEHSAVTSTQVHSGASTIQDVITQVHTGPSTHQGVITQIHTTDREHDVITQVQTDEVGKSVVSFTVERGQATCPAHKKKRKRYDKLIQSIAQASLQDAESGAEIRSVLSGLRASLGSHLAPDVPATGGPQETSGLLDVWKSPVLGESTAENTGWSMAVLGDSMTENKCLKSLDTHKSAVLGENMMENTGNKSLDMCKSAEPCESTPQDTGWSVALDCRPSTLTETCLQADGPMTAVDCRPSTLTETCFQADRPVTAVDCRPSTLTETCFQANGPVTAVDSRPSTLTEACVGSDGLVSGVLPCTTQMVSGQGWMSATLTAEQPIHMRLTSFPRKFPSGLLSQHPAAGVTSGEVLRKQGLLVQQLSGARCLFPTGQSAATADHDYTDVNRPIPVGTKALKTLVKPISLAQHISARVEKVEERHGESLVTISGHNTKASHMPDSLCLKPRVNPEGMPVVDSLAEVMTDTLERMAKYRESYRQATEARPTPPVYMAVSEMTVAGEVVLAFDGQESACRGVLCGRRRQRKRAGPDIEDRHQQGRQRVGPDKRHQQGRWRVGPDERHQQERQRAGPDKRHQQGRQRVGPDERHQQERQRVGPDKRHQQGRQRVGPDGHQQGRQRAGPDRQHQQVTNSLMSLPPRQDVVLLDSQDNQESARLEATAGSPSLLVWQLYESAKLCPRELFAADDMDGSTVGGVETEIITKAGVVDVVKQMEVTTETGVVDVVKQMEVTTETGVVDVVKQMEVTTETGVVDDAKQTEVTTETSVVDDAKQTEVTTETGVVDDVKQTDVTTETGVVDDVKQTDVTTETGVVDDVKQTDVTTETGMADGVKQTEVTTETGVVDDVKQTDVTTETGVADGVHMKPSVQCELERSVSPVQIDNLDPPLAPAAPKVCSYCLRLFSSSCLLYSHVKSVHTAYRGHPQYTHYLQALKQQARILCPYCPRKQYLSSRYRYRSHLAHVHKQQMIADLGRDQSVEGISYQCDARTECEERSGRGSEVTQPDCKNPNFCQLCSKSFRNQFQLCRHVEHTHQEVQFEETGLSVQRKSRIKCPCCQADFLSVGEMQEHKCHVHTKLVRHLMLHSAQDEPIPPSTSPPQSPPPLILCQSAVTAPTAADGDNLWCPPFQTASSDVSVQSQVTDIECAQSSGVERSSGWDVCHGDTAASASVPPRYPQCEVTRILCNQSAAKPLVPQNVPLQCEVTHILCNQSAAKPQVPQNVPPQCEVTHTLCNQSTAEARDCMLTGSETDGMATAEARDYMVTGSETDGMATAEARDYMLTGSETDGMATAEARDYMVTGSETDGMATAEARDCMVTDSETGSSFVDTVLHNLSAEARDYIVAMSTEGSQVLLVLDGGSGGAEDIYPGSVLSGQLSSASLAGGSAGRVVVGEGTDPDEVRSAPCESRTIHVGSGADDTTCGTLQVAAESFVCTMEITQDIDYSQDVVASTDV